MTRVLEILAKMVSLRKVLTRWKDTQKTLRRGLRIAGNGREAGVVCKRLRGFPP